MRNPTSTRDRFMLFIHHNKVVYYAKPNNFFALRDFYILHEAITNTNG